MSDYSPPYTEADANWKQRRDKVVAQIRKMPAENLTVGDLLDIVDAFREYRHEMSERDVRTIQKILSTHRMDHHCR